MSKIRVRAALPVDSHQLSRLREALWPESSKEEHTKELTSLLTEKKNGSMPLVIFVAEAVGGQLIGFLEAGLRSHADGCDPWRPVGFVEGWFVLENHREKGIGALLGGGRRLGAEPRLHRDGVRYVDRQYLVSARSRGAQV